MRKTGTTSIQHYLFDNEKELNILYPKSSLYRNDKNQSKLFFDKSFASTVEEIRSSTCEKIIISSENGFQTMGVHKKTDIFQEIFAMLHQEFDVFIIMYTTDPVRYMRSSFYNQHQREGFSNLNVFFEKNGKGLCSYHKTIQWYAQILGREKVIVRFFEHALQQSNTKDIVEDFCSITGIPYIEGGVKKENVSKLPIDLASNFKNYISQHFRVAYPQMKELFYTEIDHYKFMETFTKNISESNLNQFGYDRVTTAQKYDLYHQIIEAYTSYQSEQALPYNKQQPQIFIVLTKKSSNCFQKM